MTRRLRRGALLFASALLTLLACGEEPPPDFHTDHFDYVVADPSDATVCGGTAEIVEAAALALGELFEIEVEGRCRYTKYVDEEALRAADVCRSTAAACTTSSTIDTTRRVDEHELVHWVMSRRFGTDLPLLFAEGIATALSCSPYSDPVTDDWDPREFAVTWPISDARNHAQAGRLMLGVLALTGTPSAWMDLSALPKDLSPSELVTRAREELGIDLDLAWQLAVERGFGSCLPFRACSGVPLELGRHTIVAGCEGLPPLALPAPTPELGAAALRVSDAQLELRPCSVEAAEREYRGLRPRRGGGRSETWLRLPEVPHALWFHEDIFPRGDRSFDLELRGLPAAFRPECPIERDRITPSVPVGLVLDRVNEEHFGIELEAPGTLRFSLAARSEGELEIAWCEGCEGDEALGCTELDFVNTSGPVRLEGAAAGILRVRSPQLSERAFLDIHVE